MVFLGFLVLTVRLPAGVAAIYAGASLAAFAAYAIDKSAAKAGRRRTPESRLHLLALIGGWPGALAGQRLLRHKSAKPAFLRLFWLSALANCAALGGWLWLG